MTNGGFHSPGFLKSPPPWTPSRLEVLDHLRQSEDDQVNYAAHVFTSTGNASSTKDIRARLTTDINGVPIGTPTVVPIYVLATPRRQYQNPRIYITEVGMGDQDNETMSNSINDLQRIDFYTHHLHAVSQAIGQGVNVKGFIAWSFLDNPRAFMK